MKTQTFGKKLLSMFLVMALMLGMVATIPMSAFAAEAETKVLADELEGYNRITATDFESLSNERQGKSFKLASGGKTFYVGNYLGKNYLDVDVNFEGDATGAHYLRYMGNPDVAAAVYTSAFTVRMKAVGDVYFVEFGYQDEATNLNTVVPTQTLTASEYGIDGPSSDFNVKILTDISVSKEDETKEVIAYQFYLNDKFVGEGSFEETAHNRMGLCAQVAAGKTLTVKVPGEKVDPFEGYERITLSDYNATMTAGTLTAPLAHGANLTYQGTGDLNKTYIDLDVNYNGNVHYSNFMLRFYGSDRYKDSYHLSWETAEQLIITRYDNAQNFTILDRVKNLRDYGISGPSDWFNVKLKFDITPNASDATKQTVKLQLWLNDKLAWEKTVEETNAASNRNKIFVNANGGTISARVPMDVEEELKGYTPVTLDDYDGTKTTQDGKFVTTLANGGSINAPFVDFNKTYLDVDVNLNGVVGKGVANARFQSSGKWTDSYVLGWNTDGTSLHLFHYNGSSKIVDLATSIPAADHGIASASDWFNVKLRTDIAVDPDNANKQTVNIQLWLNDKLAWMGTSKETRADTSRAAIFVSTSSSAGVSLRSSIPTLEESLKDHTPITLDDYACDMNFRGEVAVANAKSITANVSKFDKTYLDVDVNFNGMNATQRGHSNFRYQASGQWTDSYALGWKNATTLDFFTFNSDTKNTNLNANIVAADYGISGPDDWFNVKIVTDIIGEGTTSQTVKLQLWLNDKLAYSGIHTESRNGTSRAAIWVTGQLAPQKVTFRSARNVEEQLEGYTRVTLEEMEGIGASRAEAGTTYNFGRAGQYLGGNLDKTYLDMDVKSNGLFLNYLMSEKTVWGNVHYQIAMSGTNLTITPVYNGATQAKKTLGLDPVGYTEGEMFNLKIRNDIDGNTVIMQFWYNNKYVAKLTFTEPAARTADCVAVYGNATTTTVVRTPMIGVTREEVAYDLSKGGYLLTGADYFYVNGKKMPSGTVLAAPNDYLVERVVDGQVADSKLVALYYLGDVNLDGSAFEYGDPVWMDGHALQGIVNYGTPMKSAMKAADINNDGKVTQADFDAFVIIRGDVTKKDEVLSQYHTDALSYEYLGGKDVMPIGGFYGPYDLDTVTDGMFQLIKESGVNLITYTPANAETSENDLQRALVLAEKYGIGVFVSDDGLNVIQKDANGNVTGQTTVTSAEDLAAHMAAYSNYNSFLGINVVDEPKGANNWATETNKNDAETYYKRYNYYEKLAELIEPYTNITSYINMHGSQSMDKGTYSAYVSQIAEDVDVLSFDTYPYFEKDAYTKLTRLAAYLESLDIVRQASLDNGKPFWSYVQAGTDYRDDSSDSATAGYYTEADTLWIVNTSLAFGAKGIQYFPLLQPEHFSYDSTSNTEHDYDRNGIIGANNETTRYYAMVQKANKQIAAIDDVLMNATNTGVIVTGNAKTNVSTAALGRNHTFTGILSQKNGVYTDMLKNVTSGSAGAMVGAFDYQGYEAYYVVNYDRTEGASQEITLTLNTQAKYRVIADADTTSGDGSDITLTIPSGAGVLVVLEEQFSAETNAVVDGVPYASVQNAVDEANGNVVTLMNDVAETITANGDVALDLNGFTITVNGGNLTLTDSATNEGGKGGKIYGSFTVKDHVVEKDGITYVTLDSQDAEDDYKTANAVRVRISRINVRPNKAGMYYTTEVKFNQNVADIGATYGVVLSTEDVPGADFATEETDANAPNLWTKLTAATGADFSSTGTSCLVTDILKSNLEDAANSKRGEMNICANAYVQVIVDGEVVTVMAENDTEVVYSLKTMMQALNTNLAAELLGFAEGTEELSETGRKALDFYKTWQGAMSDWGLNNMAQALTAEGGNVE